MSAISFLRLVTLLLPALLFCACSAGGSAGHGQSPLTAAQEAASEVPDFAGFPAPSQIEHAPSDAEDNYKRFRSGHDYNMGLPYNRVTPDSLKAPSYLNYEPLWMESRWDKAAGIASASYAAYSFYYIEEFDSLPLLNLVWTKAPTENAEVYAGFADYTKDRWVWRRLGGHSQTNFGSVEPYTSPTGYLHVIIMVLDSVDSELDYLYIGERLEPDAFFSGDLNFSDPAENLAPLTVTWDSSGSQALDSEIVKTEFDLDGDGSFDVTDDGDGLVTHTYTEPGDYVCRLRITNLHGATGSYERKFRVVDPLNTPPVPHLQASVNSGDAPLAVTFNAGMSTDNDRIISYEWDMDDNGQYEVYASEQAVISRVLGRKGVQAFKVRICDSDFATVVASVSVDVTSGWNSTLIAGNTVINDQISMVVSGSGSGRRACLAWQEYGESDLFFARAGTLEGSAWDSPLPPVSINDHTGYSPCMAISPSTGAPLIAYGLADPQELNKLSLWTVRAGNSSGSAWFGPVKVSGSEICGGTNELQIIGGRPAIASVAGQMSVEPDEIYYYYAADASGSSWNAGKLSYAVPQGVDIRALGMLESDSRLLLFNSTTEGNNVAYAMLSAADPADPQFGVGFTAAGRCDGFSTLLLGGQPAFAAGNSSQGGQLYFRRALDSQGTDWPEPEPLLEVPGDGGTPAMAILNGKPLIAYSPHNSNAIFVISANDENGDSWAEPHLVTGAGRHGQWLALEVIDDKPVLAYSREDTNELFGAWWEY